ncbi:MAG: Mur ligase family protein, partial [Candidatus Nanopelagicales bacterium]
HRVAGLEFQAVGFTNLSQDHLDFHKSMDEYLRAKAQLFDGNYSKYAVVCVDSLSGKSIADLAEANGMVVSTVSTNDLSGTWSVTEKMVGITSLNSIINPIGLKLSLNFGGEFNFANALVAVAMADQVSEISQNQINALANLTIPGRMQVIAENGVQAIVDYAHSPAAIESVIQTLRQSVPGKLILVIGAGGDRDKSKRAAMGSATVGADLVIVTDDNPRSEDPAVIRQQVIQGIESEGVTCQEIGDRREAIAAAVGLVSSSNDLVAVLGKGHEQGQQIGEKIYDFDDYTELKFAIMNRGSHG